MLAVGAARVLSSTTPFRLPVAPALVSSADFSNLGLSAELQGIAINTYPDQMSRVVLGSSLLVTLSYYWGKPRRRRCELEFRLRACAQD